MHLFSVFPTYRNLVFSVQEAFLFFFCSRANRSSLSSRIYVIHFVFGECFLVECKYSFWAIVTIFNPQRSPTSINRFLSVNRGVGNLWLPQSHIIKNCYVSPTRHGRSVYIRHWARFSASVNLRKRTECYTGFRRSLPGEISCEEERNVWFGIQCYR